MILASWYITPHGCDIAVRVQIFPMILRTLGFGLFSALRVCALMRNDWRLGSLVFLLCLPGAITPAYVYAHQLSPETQPDRFGCQLAYMASQAIHERMRVAGIVCDISSETIVIIVTLSRTFSLRGADATLAGSAKRPGLARLLLRDGTIYFAALLVLSLADMLVLVFDHVPESVIGYDYWVVPYYTPVFRTIIICRFLLTLRAIYFDDLAGNGEDAPADSLRFASRVIGSMGATVDPMQFGDIFETDSLDQDEDIIMYSRDPLATGLLMDSTTASTSANEKGVELSHIVPVARPSA